MPSGLWDGSISLQLLFSGVIWKYPDFLQKLWWKSQWAIDCRRVDCHYQWMSDVIVVSCTRGRSSSATLQCDRTIDGANIGYWTRRLYLISNGQGICTRNKWSLMWIEALVFGCLLISLSWLWPIRTSRLWYDTHLSSRTCFCDNIWCASDLLAVY